MKKKLCIVTLLVILAIASIMGTVNAANAKVSISSSKSECKKDDEITFEVKVSNIDNEQGIIALGGTINYNKDELEFVKVTNSGNWSASYNSDNGKFVADRSDRTKEDETVFNVIFKVKVEDEKSVDVKLSDLEASGGDGAIKISDANATITVKGKNSDQNNEQGNTAQDKNEAKPENTEKPSNKANNTSKPTNTNTNKNTDKNTNTNKATNTNKTTNSTSNSISIDNKETKSVGDIPKAGVNTPVVIVLIFITIGVALVIYIKYKKLDK